jgi:tetratricopeptide (TPR) repeat protein
MRRLRAYIVGLLFLTAFSEIGWAVDSYNNSYISPATVPPSTVREGLIRTPGTVDTSGNLPITGNLLITGNIRGPAYFRGVVPYSAPTDFAVTLPSSSLDSFLKDSTGVEDAARYDSYASYNLGYRPYYSPTQTAASMMPGVPTAGASPTSISDYSAQYYFAGTLPPRRDEELDTASAMSLARLRPMSMTPEEMEKLISSEIAEESPARLTEQQYKPNKEQYEPNVVGPESYKAGELGKNLTGSLLSTLRKPGSEANQPIGTPSKKEQLGEEANEISPGVPWAVDVNKQPDVYDKMKQQLDSLQKKLDLAMPAQQPAKTAEENNKPAGGQQTQGSSLADKIAEANLTAARLKSILGPYETFASFSQDKFNQSMRAAEMYLKQGKYYRAADAYTLASLYKPDDPLAYAGKSHALFASGEYMSSALFLSRALQMFPGYARFKIDLVAMVGDKDKLESRVADVEEWLKRSNAPELQFLLAYIYYQMGRPVPAKEAIDAAYEKMPQSSSVLALKKAVEDSPIPAADKDSSLHITNPNTGADFTIKSDAPKK